MPVLFGLPHHDVDERVNTARAGVTAITREIARSRTGLLKMLPQEDIFLLKGRKNAQERAPTRKVCFAEEKATMDITCHFFFFLFVNGLIHFFFSSHRQNIHHSHVHSIAAHVNANAQPVCCGCSKQWSNVCSLYQTQTGFVPPRPAPFLVHPAPAALV